MAKTTFATCSISWVSLTSVETTDSDILLAAQCWKEVDLKLASFLGVRCEFQHTLTGTQIYTETGIIPKPTLLPLILWK